MSDLPPAAAGGPPRFALSRGIFLRLLGIVYLVAFASLATQVLGLIGADGLLPAADYLERVHDLWGAEAYYRLPTLLWLWPGDAGLVALCWIGMALSVAAVAGVAPIATFAALWVGYLSLTIAGQDFLSFQWDVLLLEAGLLAVVYSPAAWRAPLRSGRNPHAASRWLVWGLAFKLTFLSGVTKLLSGDATWWSLTALRYHYETQPIPTWIGWYAHQAADWFGTLSVAVMFVIEVAVPFVIFVPPRFRRPRIAGCALLCLLQILIAATGNYGFFNLLTLVLYLSLLDDDAILAGISGFRSLAGTRWGWRARPAPGAPAGSGAAEGSPAGSNARAGLDAAPGSDTRAGLGAAPGSDAPAGSSPPSQSGAPPRPARPAPADVSSREATRPPWRRYAVASLAALLAVLSALTFVREVRRPEPMPAWSNRLLGLVAPFQSVNGYGLFRSMTTERPEIVIEGTADGVTWREYAFPWKAGDLSRAPGFVQPHMPRLDWQMWFAALDPQRQAHWLFALVDRLLENDPTALSLLDGNPFPGEPPRYIRLVMYRYRFTGLDAGASGDWWSRELMGYLTEPIPRRP